MAVKSFKESNQTETLSRPLGLRVILAFITVKEFVTDLVSFWAYLGVKVGRLCGWKFKKYY
jgi:hypothetical protein